MEFRKMVTIILYAKQKKRHRCQNRLLDSVGEGEGGMFWETGSLSTSMIAFQKDGSQDSEKNIPGL